VNVEATVTVAAVLKAAGVEPDDKLKLMVGDTPAEINTEVTDGAVVTMTERPAGS
jgi:ABC-type sugar transport system substrate-binding protein